MRDILFSMQRLYRTGDFCAIRIATAGILVAVALLRPVPLPAETLSGGGAALTPPVLLQFVEAPFPEGSGEPVPDNGEVRARLHLDDRGRVVSVAVVSASHPAFEEPARQAMSRFLFSPAKRNGVPIPAEVRYLYRFHRASAAFAEEGGNPSAPVREGAAAKRPDGEEPRPPASGAADTDTGYETTVRGRRLLQEGSGMVLDADAISRIAGIHGDAVLAIQTLPGVAKPPAMLGALFIRGSSDQDSLSLVDGLPVPTVFHFGSVNTVINSDLIDAVSFYPGNFSVRYGGGTGGVVDIHTREPATDRLHAYVDADLWDATVFIEGPLSKRWSVAASFRRSYIDGVLKATGLMESQLQSTLAPRYYDFQVKATYRGKRGDGLSLMVFGSDDKVDLGGELLGDTGYMSREIFTRTYFYAAGLSWRHRFHEGLENELSIRGGYWFRHGESSYSETELRSIPFHVRNEIRVRVLPVLRLRLGADAGIGYHRQEFREPDASVYGLGGIVGGGEITEVDDATDGRPGMYLEAEFSALPRTLLIYGVRADYDSLSGSWSADPRFEARVTPRPGTVIRGGLGLFHQPPPVSALVDASDPGRFNAMAAVHYGLSVEQTIPFYDRLSVHLGGFYKELSRTSFTHSGLGRAAGMELLVRHRPSRHFFGWVSYTLMRSERFTADDKTAVPFGFDQTHVLTVVAGVAVKYGVSFGLRFRLASGLPYTPIVGERFYDDWRAGTLPVWGEENSARMPLFHQLDLRVDKRFEWKVLSLSIYLDVQNVYNRQNEVVYIYSEGFAEKRTVYDLPVLPSLGLKVAY